MDADGLDITQHLREGRLLNRVERLEADRAALVEALEAARQLFKKALPKFDWGRSALDAEAITLLNEVPGKVEAALARVRVGK